MSSLFSQYSMLKNLETFRRLTAGWIILALLLVPMYPLQVLAEEVVEVPPVEEVEVLIEEEPEPTSTPVSEDTIIDTGDAIAETDTESNVNVNIIETQPIESDSATTTEEAEVTENSSTSTSTNLEIAITNEGAVENTATTSAATGDNNASSTSEAQITTGDAYASANAVSVVNLNLVESDGFLFMLNNFLRSLGHIDLRPLTTSPSDIAASSNPCGTSDCNASSTSLSVKTKNEAEISNVVIVRSSTGSNTAQGDGVSITTGNAYAGANVVNIANTNIINSNYLLFAFNNFSGWDGDLIFPNSDFFSSFFSPASMVSANISNTNSANVENTIETSADTGGNSAEGESGSIETGNAAAGSNMTNIVNTNLINAPTFYVVFRIFGAWNGSVFNAPEGINWLETPSGITLFSNSNDDDANGGGVSRNIDVETENVADVTSNVKVFALTGANKAVGANSSASINTGNAYAGANVLNIANTNVISSNWIIALINIFGDWSGNISFGQPDIWVATQVEGPETLNQGSEVIFHTTVANRGDAPASRVRFNGFFNSDYINFKGLEDGESYSWDVGNLSPGEIREFSYSAKVIDNGLPYGSTLVDHTFGVSAAETDGNPPDNFDVVSLLVSRPIPAPFYIPNGGGETKTTTYPGLHVTKTNSATSTYITASSTVDYTIVVRNDGGSAFEGILYDTLKDESGNIIAENNWELDEIFSNEEITITYTAIFNASTTPGIYTNYAWVEALGGDYPQDSVLGTDVTSEIASSRVYVSENVSRSEGEVLGESCGLYLDEFIRQGMDNNSEQVKKLQEFLNKEMDAGLPVTGFYGGLTFQAAKAFQKKYTDEILKPWSIEDPTGIIYQTTLRWINQLECPSATIALPTLIAWSNNPNVPTRLATIKPDPVGPAKLEDKDNDRNNTNTAATSDSVSVNTENKNLLALAISGFIGLMRGIFR